MDQSLAGTAGAQGALCTGCQRSIEEIISWATASDTEKRAVWERIAERRSVMQGESA